MSETQGGTVHDAPLRHVLKGAFSILKNAGESHRLTIPKTQKKEKETKPWLISKKMNN